MERKLKLVTILGTRPEIIRLSETIKKADMYFNHILIHTGQNYDYELSEVFFKEFGLRHPDYYLNCPGETLGETIGNVISKSYSVLKKESPDAVLILGDTNSALSAISAKRLKLPVFHMEAGNRCWDWNVSEMVNRTIVDHISDVNLPYTENSKLYLVNEGIDARRIFVTGSPIREVINAHRNEIEGSSILEKMGLQKGGYIVLSTHREENVEIEQNFLELVDSINYVAEFYRMPVIFSMHPRTRKKIHEKMIKLSSYIRESSPLGFFDYLNLEMNSKLVLSDSGTLTEEAAIIKFPAVLLRTSTERPEGLEYGEIVIGGIKKTDVLKATELAIQLREASAGLPPIPTCENETSVSTKVIKIIQSYYHIVRKETWLS